MRYVNFILLASVFAVVTACAGLARGQASWPDRPIHLIVPFPAGSSSDIVARIVAQGLSGKLGQSVVVENRPGASTAVGGEYVARAVPDGYTLGLLNTSSTITQSVNPAQRFDVVRDFVPISMLGASPFVLATYPGVPVHTTQELIALAKAEPGKHTYAEAGQATLANLAGLLFNKLANIQLTPVAYRGSEQEVLDLIAGRVDAAFLTIPPTLALIQQGQVRALAVTSSNRTAVLSEVPSIMEAGLTGYEAVLWQAINAPAGTPVAVVARVNAEINALLGERETIAAFSKVGVDAQPSTPQQLAERVAADVKKWRDVIVGAGIKAQ
jgi:tripartite-type tricarboxylate transporter receptor subunit TctC